MRKTCKLFILPAIVAVALLISAVSFPKTTVFAGESRAIVDEKTVTETSVNSGSWYYKNIDISGGKVLFNGDSLMMSKSKITNLADYHRTRCIDGSFTLRFNSFTQGNLYVGFGVNRVSAQSFENALTYNFKPSGSSLTLSIELYDATGNVTKLAEKTGITKTVDFYSDISVKSNADVEIKIGTSSENAEVLYSGKCSGHTFEGYYGFKCNGTMNVSLQSFTFTTYQYDNPYNVIDVKETFDNGNFDSNVWYSSHSKNLDYKVSTAHIENGELVMLDTNNNYFGTRYQYSNFEFGFDVVYLRQDDEVNEYGDVLKASGFFGFGFGIEAFNQDLSTTIQNELWFEFDRDQSRYILFKEARNNSYPAYKVQPFAAGYNYWKDWNKDRDGVINIKFTMLDGVFSFYSKYQDEEWSEEPIFTYDLGYTPLGTVRFTGGQTICMNLDNVYIKNLDYNAENFAENPEYKKNVVPYTVFSYTDTWDDADLIKDNTVVSGGGGCSSEIKTGSLLFVAIGALGVMTLSIKGKRRSK